MLYILVQRDVLRQLVQTAVHPHSHIAAALCTLQNLHVLTLPSPNHRSQQLQSGPLRQQHDLIHHLIHRLPCNLSSTVGTVGNPDPGIEQTKIIINLRHRPHRGTGISVGRFLVNGNSGRQSVNTLHIGLFHLSQKLPGIRRQGFHIPALTLCIDGVKCQRGFPGP